MGSLRQEFSSGGERCSDGPPLGNPSGTDVTGPHRVPGTYERVPGAVLGGFVPQGMALDASNSSFPSESCQERLLAPRQRKVNNFQFKIEETSVKMWK